MTPASTQVSIRGLEAVAPLRAKLTRIADRMLGSAADAEDVVQDAFLRWHGGYRNPVHEPEVYLRRIVTRVCLERLKSAHYRGETRVES